MKTKALWMFLLAGVWMMLPAVSRAEEAAVPNVAAEEGSADEELEYTFGTVKSVGTDQIVILEFDYDSGEEKEMTYALDPKVELDNVASLKDLVQGDEVDIDYKVEGDKKVAKVIAVARPLPAEGEDAGT
jgi:hypothetical protein